MAYERSAACWKTFLILFFASRPSTRISAGPWMGIEGAHEAIPRCGPSLKTKVETEGRGA
jgi:hypothetical protein